MVAEAGLACRLPSKSSGQGFCDSEQPLLREHLQFVINPSRAAWRAQRPGHSPWALAQFSFRGAVGTLTSSQKGPLIAIWLVNNSRKDLHLSPKPGVLGAESFQVQRVGLMFWGRISSAPALQGHFWSGWAGRNRRGVSNLQRPRRDGVGPTTAKAPGPWRSWLSFLISPALLRETSSHPGQQGHKKSWLLSAPRC